MNVLEICPYEPPASGWVTRIKYLRRAIQQRGGTCEILDIGPSRMLQRPECISVLHGRDYVAKVLQFARQGFIIHSHINAEYFRGMILALIAQAIGRSLRCRCIVTFHAGKDQPFFKGWKQIVTAPFFITIFSLAHALICNSEAVRTKLSRYQKASKITPIPAFSMQYLEYKEVILAPAIEDFIMTHSPVISTYLCFRDGFFTDVVIDAVALIIKQWPRLGLVIVGTGNDLQLFQDTLRSRHLETHVLIGNDLVHDDFMTIMSKSDVHLRTPVTDGVSSTVLEALSLKIPVVASDNGTRPSSVVTYEAKDPHDLADKLDQALRNHINIASRIIPPIISDTVEAEVDLIICANRASTATSFNKLPGQSQD
jgi:glycosyltransferase involved in cell wall biosynthesis